MRLLPNVKSGDTKPPGFCDGEQIQNADGESLIWLTKLGYWSLCVNQEDLLPWEQEAKAEKRAGPGGPHGQPGPIGKYPHELGMRFNTGKTRFDLIPQSWIRSLAQILTVGAAKYEPRNWEKGLSYSETLGSLHRHLDSWLSGERYDKETKCHHLGHVAWNALALMTMELRGIGKDDLPVDDDETMEK
jgi:hypothetical protein